MAFCRDFFTCELFLLAFLGGLFLDLGSDAVGEEIWKVLSTVSDGLLIYSSREVCV